MNAESSRSHLVVGIVIESTNITNGTVHRGKVCANKIINCYELAFLLMQLSIVDLAGSERASKTGATPEQLRVSRIPSPSYLNCLNPSPHMNFFLCRKLNPSTRA